MRFKGKRAIKGIVFLLSILVLLTGCNKIKSTIKDFKADTVGLSREFHVYDDFGNETMTVIGNKTNMEKSEVTGVILITIDGYTWQHVGSSMIAAEKGLNNIVDSYELEKEVKADKNGTGLLTGLDRKINNFKSEMVGLSRVLVIKNQAGVIVGVYEGDNVFVEESGLPNSTKVLVDGKRIIVYRCDYEIFEEEMLK